MRIFPWASSADRQGYWVSRRSMPSSRGTPCAILQSWRKPRRNWDSSLFWRTPPPSLGSLIWVSEWARKYPSALPRGTSESSAETPIQGAAPPFQSLRGRWPPCWASWFRSPASLLGNQTSSKTVRESGDEGERATPSSRRITALPNWWTSGYSSGLAGNRLPAAPESQADPTVRLASKRPMSKGNSSSGLVRKCNCLSVPIQIRAPYWFWRLAFCLSPSANNKNATFLDWDGAQQLLRLCRGLLQPALLEWRLRS